LRNIGHPSTGNPQVEWTRKETLHVTLYLKCHLETKERILKAGRILKMPTYKDKNIRITSDLLTQTLNPGKHGMIYFKP
jgi:hypothetical protein